MFQDCKELNIKINCEKFQQKLEEAMIEYIKNTIFEYIKGTYERNNYYSLENTIVRLFKKAVREIVDIDSKEIRREVKEEVIERTVEKLSLEKGEILKRFLTR